MGRREQLFEMASDCGIEIKNGSEKTKSAIGIHLLHPDLDELEDAIQVAERDNFPAIYIHRGNPRGPKFNGARSLKVRPNGVKASTLSVILAGSTSVFCGVEVDGEYTNMTLRFDRGEKAELCGYPMEWTIHNVNVEYYNPDSPTGAEWYEAGNVDEGAIYVSAAYEIKILQKLKRSVAAQFRERSTSGHRPKAREQKTILNKIQRAIDALKA